jgi:hypothetical protein
MKNYILTTLILSSLLLSQCDKPQDLPPQDKPTDLPFLSLIRNTTNEADATVILNYDEYLNDNRELYGGDFSGVFWNGIGAAKARTFAGNLTVGSYNIPWEPSSDSQESRYFKSMGVNAVDMNYVKNTYGTVLAVNATGSPTFTGFSTNIYMPKKLNVQTLNPTPGGGEFSLSSDIVLTWTPDNTISNSKVYILLLVDNPGNVPNPPVQVWETDDDGHHVIPVSAFQAYVVGGTGTIYCCRGQSTVVTQNGKEIEVVTVVSAHEPFDIVQ